VGCILVFTGVIVLGFTEHFCSPADEEIISSFHFLHQNKLCCPVFIIHYTIVHSWNIQIPSEKTVNGKEKVQKVKTRQMEKIKEKLFRKNYKISVNSIYFTKVIF